ncbi:MAG: tetratricopeptide repeat protein [Gemmatimonadota bacterium]|nr:tetratricopeptide repeat protein [Gemmatimonadota bacterium]
MNEFHFSSTRLANPPHVQRGLIARISAALCVLSMVGACVHQHAMTTAGPGLAEIIAHPGDAHRASTGEDRPIEVASLLGVGLRRPFLDSMAAAPRERNLAAAAAALLVSPTNSDALLRYGVSLAALGRYREAIDTLAVGIRLFPNEPRFYRERAQQYLIVRRPALSIADFQKAALLMRSKPDEPDAIRQPNAVGAGGVRDFQPSTFHLSVWYNLAVALYVRGDYGNALLMLDSADISGPDNTARVAIAYWRYLSLKRTGRDAEAVKTLAIANGNLDAGETVAYLRALQLFAGQTTADALLPKRGAETTTANEAVVSYGVSMYYLFGGQKAVAREIWKRMMDTNAWPSHGVLSAESELERLRK